MEADVGFTAITGRPAGIDIYAKPGMAAGRVP
jgi:hypothetical protein